ncbi:MAG: lysophospholipid acyltransferase family protein, partial [Candidatus Zixiibacteriota bacterium]
MKIIDKENVPSQGAFLLAGNHISYYDPPMYGSFLPRAIHFMGKKELFDNKLIGAIISRTNAHPINRRGFDRAAIKTAMELLNNGEGLLVFPEGTRSKTDNFLPPKAGIGMLARKAMVPIVPAYIHGSNKLKDCFWGREKMGLIYGAPITEEEIEKFDDSREGY